MTLQQLFSNHNCHKKFTKNRGKKRKTFLNLIHSAVKLKHTFLKLAKGGRVGKAKMSLVPIHRKKKKERKKVAIREQTTGLIFTDCHTVQATLHLPLPFCHSIPHVLLAYLVVCPRLRELAPSHQPQMVDHR